MHQGLNVAVPSFHYLSYGIHSLSWTDVIKIDALWFLLWESHWSGSQHDSANTCHDWAEGIQNNGGMSKKGQKQGQEFLKSILVPRCRLCDTGSWVEVRWHLLNTPTVDFCHPLDMLQIKLTSVQCSSSKLYLLWENIPHSAPFSAESDFSVSDGMALLGAEDRAALFENIK